MRRLLAILLFIAPLMSGCASHRVPVPPGTIPSEQALDAEDEQYGHEVLGELSRQYPLDRDDAHINRVRDIVDKITDKGIGSKNPWHVYVLVSSDFKNAAATRGDYIFVWTGLLDTLKSDDELATVLSHEIGHVLAGHTAADPTEEATKILSGAAGNIASQILQTRGIPGVVGDLAGQLLELGIQAVVVNPGQRSKELEADLIGMFLMAKAGINPDNAVDFWTRVRLDPDFSNSALTFLSTHPSSDERLEQLKQYLPDAERVFKGAAMPPVKAISGGAAGHKERRPKVSKADNQPVEPRKVPDTGPDHSGGFALGSGTQKDSEQFTAEPARPETLLHGISQGPKSWEVEESSTTIYADANESSKPVGSLSRGTKVTVESDERRWLKISAPQAGYVRSKDLAPLR